MNRVQIVHRRFHRDLATKLGTPVVNLPPELWDQTDLDPLSKSVGWAAFKQVLTPSGTEHPSASALFTPSVLVFCDERLLATTSDLDDATFDHYLTAVCTYAAIVWRHHDVLDEYERQRRADNDWYDEHHVGYKLITEIAVRAARR